MEAYAFSEGNPYSTSMEKFLDLIQLINGSDTKNMTFSQFEALIESEGRELLRTILEERIRQAGNGNIGKTVVAHNGCVLSAVRDRKIRVKTLFGEVGVERTIYSEPGHESLAPKEAILNFPSQSYSHSLEKRLAYDAARGSFEEAVDTVNLYTGMQIPKSLFAN